MSQGLVLGCGKQTIGGEWNICLFCTSLSVVLVRVYLRLSNTVNVAANSCRVSFPDFLSFLISGCSYWFLSCLAFSGVG